MYLLARVSPAVDALVVRFDKKTGAFEEKRVCNLDAAFSAFKAALYLWKVNKVELFETRVGGVGESVVSQ